MLDEEICWESVIARDRDQDGRFYFGVTTTGIFCRPSCAARRPLRKNVRFFLTADEAASQGLRPCRRCHPLDRAADRHTESMRELCAFIDQHCDSGEPMTLAVLAPRVGLSESRLRRVFRQIVGVTPRQYVEARRFEKLKQELKTTDSVTDAIYESGFASSSRVYEQASDRLGMTPSEYQGGGEHVEISYATAETNLGLILVAATDRGLCSVQFADTRDELVEGLKSEFPAARLQEMPAQGHEHFSQWMGALRRHLDGDQPSLDLPLDVRASAFKLRVWRYLQKIPYGETRSYAEVAAGISQPKAVRAVARACAANRTALVIPCHRVIRSSGGLGGFRWGESRKRQLLDQERTIAAG